MNYKGTIIEESLSNRDVLREVKLLGTKVETVTPKHKTPWLKHWTLYDVEIPEEKADVVAGEISASLETEHPWYTDFKNNKFHFIIYRGKIFKVDLKDPILYEGAKTYGISLGIPPYQVDFAPKDEVWER